MSTAKAPAAPSDRICEKLHRNINKCIYKTSPVNIYEIPSMQIDVKQ